MKRYTDILDMACNLSADSVVLPLQRNGLSLGCLKSHEVITRIHRKNVSNDFIHSNQIESDHCSNPA